MNNKIDNYDPNVEPDVIPWTHYICKPKTIKSKYYYPEFMQIILNMPYDNQTKIQFMYCFD